MNLCLIFVGYYIFEQQKVFRQPAERFRARLCRGFGGQGVFYVREL